MEPAATPIGGLLLIIGVGGGARTQTRLATIDNPAPRGDRVAAGLPGGALIALAALLSADADNRALVVLGACGLVVVGYATLLFLGDEKPLGCKRRKTT
jgi:hypothetical protein